MKVGDEFKDVLILPHIFHRLGSTREDKNIIVSHLQLRDILGGDHLDPNASQHGLFPSNRDIDFIAFFLKPIIGIDILVILD
jgi:hypothetical protein